MEMADVHHIAIYDDLIAAKVQGCTCAYDAPSGGHPQIMKNIATRVYNLSLNTYKYTRFIVSRRNDMRYYSISFKSF